MWFVSLCIRILTWFFVLHSIECYVYGYFWHITDIHLDRNYSRFGNVKNGCHKKFEDIFAYNFTDNGLYGNFQCDAPEFLFNTTIENMKDLHSRPDFIVWTGDNMPHSKNGFDMDTVYTEVGVITDLLIATFPNVTIIPSIGNHDVYPHEMLHANNTSDLIYNGFLEKAGWEKLLRDSERSSFMKGGFYSTLVSPGLRVIALNTILWLSENNENVRVKDPEEQFQWLETVLSNSIVNQEKVYITGHIPPGFYPRTTPKQNGIPMYHQHFVEHFQSIVNNYSDVIIGQFYGHFHLDMFQIFEYKTGTSKGSAFIAPPVSPRYDDQSSYSLPVNPSVRLVRYSTESGGLLDYTQFYLDLDTANCKQKASYQPLYTFTETFGVPDLSTTSLTKAFIKLQTNSAMFNEFFRHLTADKRTKFCNKDCKTSQLCSMCSFTNGGYNKCLMTGEGYYQKYNFESPVNDVLLYISVTLLVIVVALLMFILYKGFWGSDRKGGKKDEEGEEKEEKNR